MTIRLIGPCLCAILLMSAVANAQKVDTIRTINKVRSDLNAARTLSHDYKMDAKFPNGNTDHIAGNCFLDADNKLLYNNSDLFTVLYTGRWFYKADHKHKTTTIIDLLKEKDKKMKKIREKAVFKDDPYDAVFDTASSKHMSISRLKYEGNVYKILLTPSMSSNIKGIEVVYDTLSKLPLNITTVMRQPHQNTDKGFQYVETTVACTNFKRNASNLYSEDSFFYTKNNKIILRKYDNYKLITKL